MEPLKENSRSLSEADPGFYKGWFGVVRQAVVISALSALSRGIIPQKKFGISDFLRAYLVHSYRFAPIVRYNIVSAEF